jgi:hypothetical protein
MVEPISLTAGALATLVLTKAFEKTGEKLGESVLEQSGKLMKLIRDKAPRTASQIDLAHQESTVAHQYYLIGEMEELARADFEIAQVIEDLVSEIRRQLSPSIIQQVMASDIKAGSLKAGNLTQKAKMASSVEQTMASNLEAENIEFGVLEQEI